MKAGDFELFKSNICQKIKKMSFEDKMKYLSDTDMIDWYISSDEAVCGLYLVAMCDYQCRINSKSCLDKLEKYRKYRMAELIYPAGILMASDLLENDDLKKEALKNAEPEFLRFNIVEGEIENVC